MKINTINILLAVVFGFAAFTGCKKDNGPIPKRIEIEDVPAVTTNIETGRVDTIRFANQVAFEGKFKVSLYFSGVIPPDKVDIVIRKNGLVTNVKLYKANVTSLPTSFTVTAAEIATIFGTAIALKDTYDFAPDLYVGAKKYEAFPATGAGTGAGVRGMPGFGEFVRYTTK